MTPQRWHPTSLLVETTIAYSLNMRHTEWNHAEKTPAHVNRWNNCIHSLKLDIRTQCKTSYCFPLSRSNSIKAKYWPARILQKKAKKKQSTANVVRHLIGEHTDSRLKRFGCPKTAWNPSVKWPKHSLGQHSRQLTVDACWQSNGQDWQKTNSNDFRDVIRQGENPRGQWFS